MLQVQATSYTQEHEGISESLTAMLLPGNIFPRFDVQSYTSSGAEKSLSMGSVGRKQKTVGTPETASQLSYKLPKRACIAAKVHIQPHSVLGC